MTDPVRKPAVTITWEDATGVHQSSFDDGDPEIAKLTAKLTKDAAKNVKQRVETAGAVVRHPDWRQHPYVHSAEFVGFVPDERPRGEDGLVLASYTVQVWEPPAPEPQSINKETTK